jgi:hypothetical protein
MNKFRRIAANMIDVPMTVGEAHAVLRVLANGNVGHQSERQDAQAATWVAERIIKAIEYHDAAQS